MIRIVVILRVYTSASSMYALLPQSATTGDGRRATTRDDARRDVVGEIDHGESSVGFVRARYRRCRRRRRGLVRAAVRLVSVRCTHRNEPHTAWLVTRIDDEW
jgi:hypothetical protein